MGDELGKCEKVGGSDEANRWVDWKGKMAEQNGQRDNWEALDVVWEMGGRA